MRRSTILAVALTALSATLWVTPADAQDMRSDATLGWISGHWQVTEGGQVIVSGTLADGELRIRVRDNGVGMSKNEIAYAMQPFHQLDTAPRRQSGTGLGLPLTKALADANRARLELTSEPGVGTSADIIFPVERLFSS